MKRISFFLTEILIALTFLFITGIPFIWMRKTFLPSHVYILTSAILILIFCLYWQDFLRFNKKPKIWITALIVLILAVFRKNFIPPFTFKIYDLFLIFIALSLIYERSRIKDLFVFTSILIAPLALAELYGFMPSCILSVILLGVGFAGGLILPRFSSFVNSSKDARKNRKGFNNNKLDIILLLFLGILLGVFSILIFVFPKGDCKNRRVLFDIGHESMESPQLIYNINLDISESFGHGKLVEFLRYNDFDVNFTEDISRYSLGKADILVLIMSTFPYTKEEMTDIKEFVLNGGGLLVIGDHTDINNIGSSLNPVIEQFGIRFLFDTIWLQTNERVNLRYRPHPIHFDLKKVNFSVGASLRTMYPARPIIQSSYAAYSDYGDANNAVSGYLGNSILDDNERIHDLPLVAECQYGKGRVLVFGDSAYFQNTSLYENRLFALRVFAWLNNKKGDDGWRRISILIMPFLLVFLFILVLYRRRLSPDIIFVSLCLSIVFSIWAGGIVNSAICFIPKEAGNTILIDMAHKNEYGTYWTNRAELDISLDGFVSQIVRLGYHPVIKLEGDFDLDELKRHKALLIICPNNPFSSEEIEAVAQFCENGGGLLLVEGARKWACISQLWERFDLFKDRYPLSANEPILSPFGLPIRLPYGKFEAEFIYHPITFGLFQKIRMVNPCRIRGGLPVAFINRQPVICFKEFGRGRIIAVGDDRIFASYMVEKETKVIDREKIKFIWNIINYLTYE